MNTQKSGPSPALYQRLLFTWLATARKYIYHYPDRPDLACYGTGYNNWGVQTNQKALAAFAVTAMDPTFNARLAGMPQTEAQDLALAMLRFSCASHVSGNYHCTDHEQWGHTWISGLGVERMWHAVEALDSALTSCDRECLRAMLLSECDWLLDNYAVQAGPVENNKPESNLWNGAILFRAHALYPDASRRDAYAEKGARFLANAVSVPGDAKSDQKFDGKRLGDLHVGHNYFASFALDHHHYLNVGYMAICLSNIAMLHFMYKRLGIPAPAILYLHARELWQLVKTCTAPDGRLVRIGGDTRVRYCYCQDYCLPAWLWALDYLGDTDVIGFEKGWLALVGREVKVNNDGSFLSQRCDTLTKVSPYYYTRLEADRAATLSMAAYWRSRYNLAVKERRASGIAVLSGWSEEYHGAVMARGAQRLASWVWMSGEPPTGLCLPIDHSNLVEWKENLNGEVRGLGKTTTPRVTEHKETLFDGGFISMGMTYFITQGLAGEGQKDEELGGQQVVFAALPDDQTCILLQYARANELRRTYLAGVKGIKLSVPNDIFNGNQRRYTTQRGVTMLRGVGSRQSVWRTRSAWLNVDNSLSVAGVYGIDQLSVYRPGHRQIGIKGKPEGGGMLYTDEICAPCRIDTHSVNPGTVLYDVGCVLLAAATAVETKKRVALNSYVRIDTGAGSLVRLVSARGRDGKTYLLAANFDVRAMEVALDLPGAASIKNVADGTIVKRSADGKLRWVVAGKGAGVWVGE
jgi:hypothetical protein